MLMRSVLRPFDDTARERFGHVELHAVRALEAHPRDSRRLRLFEPALGLGVVGRPIALREHEQDREREVRECEARAHPELAHRGEEAGGEAREPVLVLDDEIV
jgi:hypothetical protein